MDPAPLSSARAHELMRLALDAATDTFPRPNPRVGAVVLDRDGAVVAVAAHRQHGQDHAEAAALATAGARAEGGTVVSTLEPCNHTGMTPPCTDAILRAGIRRVVVGARDPDERVAGRGIGRLRDAGIDVVTGVESEAVEAADPGYFHQRRTGRPLVTVKLAATLDGQAAAADGTSRWITSAEARAAVHRRRAMSDAVVVGAGTLRADDPELTARNVDLPGGRQPVPVIVAGRGPLPASARALQRGALVYAPVSVDHAGETVLLPDGDGAVDLVAMIADLGGRGFLDVLVEGGPTLAAALLDRGLVDHMVIHLGAKLGNGVGRPMLAGTFASLPDAIGVSVLAVETVGPDIEVVATVTPARDGSS